MNSTKRTSFRAPTAANTSHSHHTPAAAAVSSSKGNEPVSSKVPASSRPASSLAAKQKARKPPHEVRSADAHPADPTATTAAENDAEAAADAVSGEDSSWRVARVFISSTFLDFQAERRHLNSYVLPWLRERLARRRVRLHFVDLRWGVTQDESSAGQSLARCLREVDNCRPFFVGLLGERYGRIKSMREREALADSEVRFEWLRTHQENLSVTHLEMAYGALLDPSKASALFCVRDPGFLAQAPLSELATYREESESARAGLRQLKREVRESGHPILDGYSCSWGHDGELGNGGVVGLEQFGEFVRAQLWAQLDRTFPRLRLQLNAVERLRVPHDNVLEENARFYVERPRLYEQMDAHALCDEAALAKESPPLVVIGEPGSGKSALLAAYVQRLRTAPSAPALVYHFVGRAPRSTDIRDILSRLCGELAQLYPTLLDAGEISDSFQELQALFARWLSVVGEQQQRPLVLVLDALNQVDASWHAHSLAWLPQRLPPRVRLVCSTLRGRWLDSLKRRSPVLVRAVAQAPQQRADADAAEQGRRAPPALSGGRLRGAARLRQL